jgi:Fanconi-associated nuclease 1
LLLPALLTAFRKRQYGKVDYIRTASIFRSRQALLDYEEALALESRVDEAFGGNGDSIAQSPAQKAPLKGKDLKGKGKVKAEMAPSKNSSRVEGAKAVQEIWTSVYDHWKGLVACKDEAEKVQGLERFDCGASVLPI